MADGRWQKTKPSSRLGGSGRATGRLPATRRNERTCWPFPRIRAAGSGRRRLRLRLSKPPPAPLSTPSTPSPPFLLFSSPSASLSISLSHSLTLSLLLLTPTLALLLPFFSVQSFALSPASLLLSPFLLPPLRPAPPFAASPKTQQRQLSLRFNSRAEDTRSP